MSAWQLVARRTWRIGIESLWWHPQRGWAVSLRNRSYASSHPIPAENVARWKRRLAA